MEGAHQAAGRAWPCPLSDNGCSEGPAKAALVTEEILV